MDSIISLLKQAVYNSWSSYGEIFLKFFTLVLEMGIREVSIYSTTVPFCCGFFFFFPFRVWLEVNRKWSYILLDSNLTKCICGLKLAFLKRGVVVIGYIWGLLCHLGYKVLWLYSQNETSVLIAKLYSPCLNTLWGVLFKILFFLF